MSKNEGRWVFCPPTFCINQIQQLSKNSQKTWFLTIQSHFSVKNQALGPQLLGQEKLRQIDESEAAKVGTEQSGWGEEGHMDGLVDRENAVDL